MSKSDVNTVAAEGFEKAATVYEEARPSYPSQVIDLIKSLYDKPDIILDLGAGTGKLTRLLGPIEAREIIAIEPVSSMRENLKKFPIITKIIDGTAEHIPCDDHTIDIILCGQSFHWFATHRALVEIHRVLKTNGLLILIWNRADSHGKEWLEKLSAYVESYQPEGIFRYKTLGWQQAFENQKYFSSLESKQFINSQRITRDLAIKKILSTSFIAILSNEEKTKLIENIENILDNVEEIRDVEEFDTYYLTHVYWCSSLKSSA